jgi:hypothetical protein
MARKNASAAEPVMEAEMVDEQPFTQFIEHQKKAITEIGRAINALIPEAAREHGDTALKEMVEGYRRLFNSTVDEIIKTVERIKIEEKKPVE